MAIELTHAPHPDELAAGPLWVMHATERRMAPHPETSHTDHGVTYVVAGTIEMTHGEPLRAEAGTLTLVPAGVPHRTQGGADVEYWHASFCATCLGLSEDQPLMEPFARVRHGASPVVAIPERHRGRLLRRFRELHEESTRRDPESPALRHALLSLLLGEARRAMPTAALTSTPAAGSWVGEALAFIQRRCLEPISLRDVATAVHRAPTHVAAALKAQTGYTAGDWIRAGRVAAAAQRLAHSDASLDEIAVAVGWRDTTHFIRQFRRAYGVTPAAWRRSHRAVHAR